MFYFPFVNWLARKVNYTGFITEHASFSFLFLFIMHIQEGKGRWGGGD